MGGRLWVSRHLTERMCWCQWLNIGKRGDGSFPYISSTCSHSRYLRCSLGFKSCCDIIPYCFSSCYAIFSSFQRIHFFHLFQCTWICVCVFLWEVKNSTKQLLEISSTNLVAVIDVTASLLGVIELIFTAFRVFLPLPFYPPFSSASGKARKEAGGLPNQHCYVFFSLMSFSSVYPPPINASLFATHLMAMCCPGLWLMATIQPDKFPWVGASWLTQRRNSLLLSAELTA